MAILSALRIQSDFISIQSINVRRKPLPLVASTAYLRGCAKDGHSDPPIVASRPRSIGGDALVVGLSEKQISGIYQLLFRKECIEQGQSAKRRFDSFEGREHTVKTSILVHNLNRVDDLRRCLASIAIQSHRPLELVLLDAGSTDGSLDVIAEYAETLRSCGIEFRFAPCCMMGVAASRNHAASQATGELLIFIDNDACFESKNVLENVAIKFSIDTDLAILAFGILQREGQCPDLSAWVYRRSAERWARTPFETFTFAGAAFCARADVFNGLGGFWSYLQYSREEEELAMGTIHAGWKILYSPDILVRHFPNPIGRFSAGQRRWIELRNGILVMWRRLPIPIAVVAVTARILMMSAKTLLRNQGSPLRLLSAVQNARFEWRTSHLQRAPISCASVIRYAALHFSSAYVRRTI